MELIYSVILEDIMKLFKTLFFLPFIVFNLFSMDSKIDTVITRPWHILPPEVQLNVIRQGVQTAKSAKEAIVFVKKVGAINSTLRDITKQDCIFLINNIAKSKNQEFIIALGFVSLAEKWFQQNTQYITLYSGKSLSAALTVLKKKENTDITRENSDVLVDYLARKFHVSAFKVAFNLGDLAGKWFGKRNFTR